MAPHYWDFDFKMTSEAKIQPVFLKVEAVKTLSYHGHALVTLYVQFLCSDWSKFDRWVHVENLYSNLKLVYFDSWSWQSFERRENRVMHRNTGKLLYILGTYYGVLHEILTFLTVFFRRMYKMKYSCYQESSVIHGWFVYWVFGWEIRRLSKSEIRFRMASFSFFTLLDAQEGLKVSSDSGLTWYLSGAASRMVSLSIYWIWCLFVFSFNI